MGDWDQEGFIDWLAAGSPIYQEGAGYVDPGTGQLSNMVPTQQVGPAPPKDTSMWDAALGANRGFKYTPQQLGWSAAEAKKFTDAGITKLPEWFNKKSIYSGEFHLGNNDPVSSFISLYNTPMNKATNQWSGAEKAYNFLSGSGGSEEDPGVKEAYLRHAFGEINNARDSWWDRNEGWVMGVGGMATVGLGGYLAEAGLAGEAALGATEGGATAGGGWVGALEGGMGAYGPTGAGASGSLGGIGAGGAGALGGTEVGGAAGTGVSGSIESLGGTGGSGSWQLFGTNPAGSGGLYGTGTTISNTSGAGGLFGTGVGGSEALGSAGVGASAGWLDSISNLFGNGALGTNSTTGSGLISNLFGDNWLSSLIGVGGAIGGGVMANNAMQDAIKEMQKYNKPFYDLGVSNIGALNAADPTGGAGQFINQLKDYGTNFEFDYENPAYTQQLAETTRLNDQNLAARGMYNSRAGLNLQDQSQRNLVTTEFDKQYSRGYTNIMDMFNMTSKNAGTKYGKLLDMVKIGSGAAGAAGAGSLASGQSTADLYSGLGAMPMNYMILQNMLSGSK